MEILDISNGMEKKLSIRAEETRTPLSGGFELLPFCNMNCNMCYVRNNNPKQWKQVLSADQWIEIAQKAMEQGTLYLLLTGGEPLLHPEFKKIYLALQSMGFIITINTNGTLITEEWADFFAENPCRRLNITLYGASNGTYNRLCHNPHGFDQVMNALRLLLSRRVSLRLNMTVVQENRDDIEQLAQISRNLGIPFVPTTYMFPPERKGGQDDNLFWQSRMSPREAAESRLQTIFLMHPETNPQEQAYSLVKTLLSPKATVIRNAGFTCKAGLSEYWVSWKGELYACGMIPDPSVNLLTTDFADAWSYVGKVCDEKKLCVTCKSCPKKMFCQTCAAACKLETGDFSGRPEYLCQVTDAMLDCVLDYFDSEEERNYYRKELDAIFSKVTNPKLSIIIPVYNSNKYLERCIDSVLIQSFQSFELILVDDGSTDNSSEICDHYEALDTRVKVIHQENKGVSAARNAGIKAATAPYIMFLDSDDWVEINWCVQLYKKITDNPDALVMCNVWAGEETHDVKIKIDIGIEDKENIPISIGKNIVLFAYVWNKIYHKDWIIDNKIYFDESLSYNEDYLFNVAYLNLCKKVIFIDESLNIYMSHENSLSKIGMRSDSTEVIVNIEQMIQNGTLEFHKNSD